MAASLVSPVSSRINLKGALGENPMIGVGRFVQRVAAFLFDFAILITVAIV